MRLRNIRYFVAAVELRSMRAAAERMGVAQPALSRRISDLERELGFPLLERHSYGVTTTAGGAALYEDVKDIHGLLARAVESARIANDKHARAVRLGLVANSRRYDFIHAAIVEFQNTHDGTSISLVRDNSLMLASEFSRNHLDIAILYEPSRAAPCLEERLIHAERYMFAVDPAHPLAKQKEVSLRDLAGVELVWLARERNIAHHDLLCKRFLAAGIEPCISHVAFSYEEVVDLAVATGSGFLAVASTLRSIPPGTLVYRPLIDLDLELQLKLVWRSGAGAPARRLLRCLNEEIDRHQENIRLNNQEWFRLLGRQMVALP